MRAHIKKKIGKMTILVTAGPTREKIDPVRFISNYSTGTFGYEIAREAARRRHKVVLVSGPTALEGPRGVRIVRVESAAEMLEAVRRISKKADCVIMAAAVSDWRPRIARGTKIKRSGSIRALELVENPDILSELGTKKKCILVGFALETEALEKNAAAKLAKKNLDLLVANKITKNENVFGRGRTDVVIMGKEGVKERHRRKTKKGLAKIILDKALNLTI